MFREVVNPDAMTFADDGRFPNSRLPLLIYRLPPGDTDDPPTFFERLFASHNWSNSWRNGVYDFAHYHSTTHEVLAVYGGQATLRFGGPTVGADVEVVAGNIIVIPAGVSHQRIDQSGDFHVVGAYPEGRHWDTLRGLPGDRPAADKRLSQVPVPITDPYYGADGPLTQLWSPRTTR